MHDLAEHGSEPGRLLPVAAVDPGALHGPRTGRLAVLLPRHHPGIIGRFRVHPDHHPGDRLFHGWGSSHAATGTALYAAGRGNSPQCGKTGRTRRDREMDLWGAFHCRVGGGGAGRGARGTECHPPGRERRRPLGGARRADPERLDRPDRKSLERPQPRDWTGKRCSI